MSRVRKDQTDVFVGFKWINSIKKTTFYESWIQSYVTVNMKHRMWISWTSTKCNLFYLVTFATGQEIPWENDDNIGKTHKATIFLIFRIWLEYSLCFANKDE